MVRYKVKDYFLLKNINPAIKFITLADVIVISGWGLMSPILAVYFLENIRGASLEVVGIAMTIYLLVKSLGQIPAAYIVDKIKGEKDDFFAVLFGYLVYTLMPLLYIFIETPIQLYAVQIFYGLGAAVAYPAWYAIFTRHIDHEKEGVEWGVYYTLIDLGGAFAAGLGGFIASRYGFTPLFLTVSAVMFTATLFFLLTYKFMQVKSHDG